jgi:hypothetical protein
MFKRPPSRATQERLLRRKAWNLAQLARLQRRLELQERDLDAADARRPAKYRRSDGQTFK